MCVCLCVCEGEEEEREVRGVVLGGSVGGWVGEYVLVRVCVVYADSLRSVPQDKMELNSFVR